ncbi:transglutaminase domain-containing protein [Flavobacterium ardleyense]|uniref:Transglutaminase domain-containing protein n=1 Tax=Flavobacterium ardleyense TaxID=2038737 RepID=A0ABW5Z3I8_9FLAO
MKILQILFLLIFTTAFSQNNNVLELAKSKSNKKIEIEELIKFANENITVKLEKARFFYYWMNLNIKYDNEQAQVLINSKNLQIDIEHCEDYKRVYSNRKGICAGYSSLFKHFMDKSGIECVSISGYVKRKENLIIEPEIDITYRHGWNAIKIENSWLFVDTTWAKQYENGNINYYFATKPNELILSHFPDKKEWQLIENPISIDEFNKQPYVNSMFFETGFEALPKLTSDNNYYYFEIPKNKNKNWLIKLTFSDEEFKNESVFPEYFEKEKTKIYKFKKEIIKPKSILSVTLSKFSKYSMEEFSDIIIYLM